MKRNYLFPNQFKIIGYAMLIPSAIIGVTILIKNYEPELFNLNVPAIFIDEVFGKQELLGMVNTNILNEIIGVLVILSLLFVAFSKEKQEDEYISKIRLESLVWAVYVNYAVLLLAILFVFGISFLWIMIFNMFTILLFFIIRFNWQIFNLKKSMQYDQ